MTSTNEEKTAIILTSSEDQADDYRMMIQGQWGYTVSGVYTTPEQATRYLMNPTTPPGALFLAGTKSISWIATMMDTLAQKHIAVFFLSDASTMSADTTESAVAGGMGSTPYIT